MKQLLLDLSRVIVGSIFLAIAALILGPYFEPPLTCCGRCGRICRMETYRR